MLALSPALAEARAGSGGSSGSRGSRTYSPNRAVPMQRSMTQPSPTLPSQPGPAMQARPQATPSPGFNSGMAAPAAGPSFGRSLMGGMAGGFLGAGLFSLFTGGNRAHAESANGGLASSGGNAAAGFASLMSILFQIALVGGLVWLLWRWIARRREAGATVTQPRYMPPQPEPNNGFFGGNKGGGNGTGPWGGNSGGNTGGPWGGNSGGNSGGNTSGNTGGHTGGPWGGSNGGNNQSRYAADPTRPIAVGEADEERFAQILVDVQNAWSHGDLNKMRRLLTPEMMMYFSDELSSLSSRGLRNRIEDVTFLGGQVEEAWSEEGRDYATARIQFRARDYTVSLDDETRIVQGNKTMPVEITEVWTFVRAANGGAWIVSAIQQV